MANPNRQGRYPGHGQMVPRSRFAIPIRGFVRGVPVRSNTAPWFLKPWGSTDLRNQHRRGRIATVDGQLAAADIREDDGIVARGEMPWRVKGLVA